MGCVRGIVVVACAASVGCGPGVGSDDSGGASGGGSETEAVSTGVVDSTGPGTTAADGSGTTSGTGTTTGDGPEPACPDGGPTPQIQLLTLADALTDKEGDGTYLAPGARDVDGDGQDDLVVSTAERVFVLHGGFSPDAETVADVGGGFEIVAIAGESIRSASIVGDVTGDGLADIGVAGVDDTDCDCSGGDAGCNGSAFHRDYIVAGTASTDPIALVDVADGTGGFAVVRDPDNAPCQDRSEFRAAGDVDGDGIGDFIWAPGIYGGTMLAGKPDFDPLPWGEGDTFGFYEALHAAGDFDGDGIGDLVGRDGNDVLIFLGTMGGEPTLTVTVVGANGANSPIALGVGDINGDDLADVAIQDVTLERFHIVFGGAFSGTVDLADIAAGQGGFSITLDDDYVSRRQIAAAGDVNGDGLDDVAVTDYTLSDPAVPRAYVVYGQTGTEPVSLCDAALGMGGFGIVGTDEHPTDHAAGAGDLDGDGRAELRVQTSDGIYVVAEPG